LGSFSLAETLENALISYSLGVKNQDTDNKVRELIAVKVIHTSLLNFTVVAFEVLPLGNYAPMPVFSPPFITILKLNDLQSCLRITLDVIKMPTFQHFLNLHEHKKKPLGARSSE
jgi:hypothetical protein